MSSAQEKTVNKRKRSKISVERQMYARKVRGLSDRIDSWINDKSDSPPPILFLYLLNGQVNMKGHPELVRKLEEAGIKELVDSFLLDSQKTHVTGTKFKKNENIEEDTFDDFLAKKKIPNAYLRNIIVNMTLGNNVGQKGIWESEGLKPQWWPENVAFTSPNFRERDGKTVMSSKDLLMVGDCLRNHLISIGFNPEKKERRESYKDEETHMPDGVNKPVPPNDNFSSDCQDSEPELQNLGSSGMPPNCSSAQRPALKTLSARCKDHLQRLHTLIGSWAEFTETAAEIKEDVFDELIGVTLGIGEQAYFKDLKDKSMEARLQNKVPDGLIPGVANGDGNCLFNSTARLLSLDECMAPLIRLGSVLFAVDHYDHLFDGFKIKLSNIDMASAFLSQNCSSFTYERRPKNSPSIDALLHHVISHEIMITSINGEFSGPLQVHFISGLVNRPINMDCEFSNRFCYAGRVNPCPCSEQRTYGSSLNIMWTNFADDGEDRINHVIPVYHVRGK